MKALEKRWYQPDALVWLLAPLALLYWVITCIRRAFYRIGLFKRHRVSVPVIIVGNISVGGNGKTPLVIRLVEMLRQMGYYPGVLTRGYGGSGIDYPCLVTQVHSAEQVGDEPCLMRQHLNCPIVVDPNRVRGANFLTKHNRCDILICDDGLQHYRLERDIEIAVIDGQRQLGNGYVLPMGPLRETRGRLNEVDFIIVNGGIARQGSYLMTLQPGRLVNVADPRKTKSINELTDAVTALAGIGNPQRFFDTLVAKGISVKTRLAFADHHQFTRQDIPEGTVLMTEKDAVKCTDLAHADCWYLPVRADLTPEFQQKFGEKVKRCMKTRSNKHGV